MESEKCERGQISSVLNDLMTEGKEEESNVCTRDLQNKRIPVKKIEVFAAAEYTIAGSVREYVEVAKIEKYKR